MTTAQELEKIQAQHDADEVAAEAAAKRAFDTLFYTTLLQTTTASIERSRSSGQLVQTAATAVGGFYTAVIGVSFSVTDHPISARALLPVVFLALAIVGSMVYLSYPTTGAETPGLVFSTSRTERMRREAATYTAIVTEYTRRRGYYVRAAIVALAMAVVLMPAPFVNDPKPQPEAAVVGTDPQLPPAPSVTSDAEASLAAIRYQAEIDQYLAAQAPMSAAQENWPWWASGALAAGLALTILVPLLIAPDGQVRRSLGDWIKTLGARAGGRVGSRGRVDVSGRPTWRGGRRPVVEEAPDEAPQQGSESGDS